MQISISKLIQFDWITIETYQERFRIAPVILHEGNTMRKIMGNKPQVSSAIIIHSPLQISWTDLLHQGQTADVSIIRANTGTFSIESLDVHLAP
jgi:hypothetical protein